MVPLLAIFGSLWLTQAPRPPWLSRHGGVLASSFHARAELCAELAEPADAAQLSALLERWYATAASVAPPPLLHTFDEDDLAEGMERRLVHLAARSFADLGSKSQAQNALKRGTLTLNGAPNIEGCRLVQPGDTLSLLLSPPALPSASKLSARLRFVSHLLEQVRPCTCISMLIDAS